MFGNTLSGFSFQSDRTLAGGDLFIPSHEFCLISERVWHEESETIIFYEHDSIVE